MKWLHNSFVLFTRTDLLAKKLIRHKPNKILRRSACGLEAGKMMQIKIKTMIQFKAICILSNSLKNREQKEIKTTKKMPELET